MPWLRAASCSSSSPMPSPGSQIRARPRAARSRAVMAQCLRRPSAAGKGRTTRRACQACLTRDGQACLTVVAGSHDREELDMTSTPTAARRKPAPRDLLVVWLGGLVLASALGLLAAVLRDDQFW